MKTTYLGEIRRETNAMELLWYTYADHSFELNQNTPQGGKLCWNGMIVSLSKWNTTNIEKVNQFCYSWKKYPTSVTHSFIMYKLIQNIIY